MSRVRKRNNLAPPAGWDEIKDQILDLNGIMRRAETNCSESGDSKEQIWGVMRANWKRSRPIYEARWRNKTMSDELYNWICDQGYADRTLIDVWRRPGYDRACCVGCVSKNTDHGGVCICRVPKEKRQKNVKCFHCGCPGCCSGDFDSDSYSDSESSSENKNENQEEKKVEPINNQNEN